MLSSGIDVSKDDFQHQPCLASASLLEWTRCLRLYFAL